MSFQPDYEHWLEVVLVALVGIGGWLWRLGRKEQAQEDRITRLEQWRTSFEGDMRDDIDRVESETETHFARIEDRLDNIEKKQHEQDVVLARIESNQENQRETLHEIKKDLRTIMGEARDGGSRIYDQPRREP